MNPHSFLFDSLVVALLLSLASAAVAQSDEGLDGIPTEDWANEVERQAARANQETFVRLDSACNPVGDLDDEANPAAPGQGALSTCNDIVFNLYLTVRELVHTANELTGNGPVTASLQLDQEGLGTALRWTAAEELAAAGSATTQFANNQLANLAARLNALRFGARGFTVAGLISPGTSKDSLSAREYVPPLGAGASADNPGEETFSEWGGFLSGSFGYGRKDDTDLEDAFDFDGSEVTLGVDYRFPSNFVLGGLVGYTEQTIDFDEAASTIRVVDGGMESEGLSGMIYGLFQGERLYASGSIGYQEYDFQVDRQIKYGSNNPDVASANSVARSEPSADTLMATLNLGYALNVSRFTVEPYVDAKYMDVTINAFAEERSRTPLGEVDFDEFQLNIAEQEIDSLDISLGARFQYTFTPSFGVIVPYATMEAHRELEGDSRLILANYSAVGESFGSDLLAFSVPTDEEDRNWWTWTAGISLVLRGGRQRSYDGPIMGGLMAYVQFVSVEDFDNYEQSIISGGIRYEF